MEEGREGGGDGVVGPCGGGGRLRRRHALHPVARDGLRNEAAEVDGELSRVLDVVGVAQGGDVRQRLGEAQLHHLEEGVGALVGVADDDASDGERADAAPAARLHDGVGVLIDGAPGTSVGAAERSPTGECTSALDGAESTLHITLQRRRLVARAAKTGPLGAAAVGMVEPLQ